MKAHILNGSPRKKGNTSFIANIFQEILETKGYSVSNSFLYELNVKPCIDCRACKKGELVCTINDDAQELYAEMENADLLVFGSPIYWSSVTAPLKMLIDRLRPYYGNKKLNEKKAALILPAGMGSEDCDLTVEMFKRIFKALGIELLGSIELKAFDIGDVEDTPSLRQQIEEMVQS